MRTRWMALALAGGLSGGCVPTNFVVPTTAAAGAAAEKSAAKPSDGAKLVYRPPVTAGQVTGANARDKAQELRDELDRDLQAHIEANDAKK